jgi:hypothetical protein
MKRKRENEDYNNSNNNNNSYNNNYNNNNNNNNINNNRNNNNNNINNNRNNNNNLPKKYRHKSVYRELNSEGKIRWGILKNIQHLNPKELEDWGYCWVIQQNVNVNSPGTPGVLFQGYNYTWSLEMTKACEEQLRQQKENKKRLKEQRKPSLSSVLPNQNSDGSNVDGHGYGDNDVPENGDVPDNSSSSSNFDNSNNFVTSLPSHVFSPSLPSVPSTTNVPVVFVVPVTSSVPAISKSLLTPEQAELQYKDLIGNVGK